jgi:hypothetical protein
MLKYVAVGVLIWIASAFWVLLTFDFSPKDSVFQGVALVIFVGGIVVGLIGVIYVIVSSVLSGRREKKQWE